MYGPSSVAGEAGGKTKEHQMDLVAYWHKHCAPYVKARFGRSEQGAALVEYALLVALIAVVCIAAITLLGRSTSQKFSGVATELQ